MLQEKDLLIKGIDELDLKLTEKQLDQFVEYYNMIIETNKVMNLTAIIEPREFIIKHFIDSLLIVKSIDMKKIDSMIDVGTGAGFPGVPLKIMFPHIHVTLLDSLNKRLKFLDTVIEKLDLKDIETIHGRAEDIGHNKFYREKYDLCVSRAVANMSSLSEYCIPFIKNKGKFVSYKSSISEEEIIEAKKAISILGGKILSSTTSALPCSNMERTLVVIDKVKSTPGKYPRKAGTPTKEPIK